MYVYIYIIVCGHQWDFIQGSTFTFNTTIVWSQICDSIAFALSIEENPLFRALNPWASTFTAPVAFSCLVIVSWFFRHQHWSSCSSRCYCQSIPPLIVDCSRAASLPDVCQRNTDLGFDSTFFAVFVDSTWHISSRKFCFGRNRKYQTIQSYTYLRF